MCLHRQDVTTTTDTHHRFVHESLFASRRNSRRERRKRAQAPRSRRRDRSTRWTTSARKAGSLLCSTGIVERPAEGVADGRIALELKTLGSDGTKRILYEPLDFLAKLTARVPRPHKNLVVYHGVISLHARLRERVVAYGREPTVAEPAPAAGAAVPKHKRQQWLELMRRAFGYDLLHCPSCGGKMALLACIMQRAAITKILGHLGLPTEPSRPAKARASPLSQSPFDYVA
jgi:hypothetical protein